MGLLPLSGSAEASPPRSIKPWALLAPAEGARLFRFLQLSIPLWEAKSRAQHSQHLRNGDGGASQSCREDQRIERD